MPETLSKSEKRRRALRQIEAAGVAPTPVAPTPVAPTTGKDQPAQDAPPRTPPLVAFVGARVQVKLVAVDPDTQHAREIVLQPIDVTELAPDRFLGLYTHIRDQMQAAREQLAGPQPPAAKEQPKAG
jgi:hypothetical protein